MRASRLVVCMSLLVGVGFGGGCATAKPVDRAPEPEPASEAVVDSALTSLRRDNADLRRRIQLLEERMLLVERRAEPEHVALPGGKSLPVVKLEPAAVAGAVSRRAEAPVEVAQAPTGRVRSRQLASLPQPEVDEQLWGSAEADYVPAPVPEGDARSFRLVGSRLVELTKAKPTRPAARSRSKRSRKAPVIKAYNAAMKRYRAGDFVGAQEAFAAIVLEHPDHDYADNALYWQGEAAYDQALYGDALAAFTAVVERYAGGNKAPDALLKIGLCYRNLGDDSNARDVLTQLIDAYPRARASDIARARLAEMQTQDS